MRRPPRAPYPDVMQRDTRRSSTLAFADSLLRDLRYSARTLVRNPGFSLLAILCLTLGIGANVVVFSWIEGILFRPYPLVTHQERLVALTGTARGEAGATWISWPDLL